ncbi:MAG: hydroxymethylglutaryl-CoA reductase, degradative [Thermoprotei archaeon]|nr:MAG: hydroxymethylglutaryl-CoA reductase, degradative [Thermoprotei archaeon]RLF15985.1 MAG: hydroxymethylglutaryl-CoA reductase, degradative [Thermoprotei archaeon]
MSPSTKTSRLPGFHKLPLPQRLEIVKEFAGLSDEEAKLLIAEAGLKLEVADRMVENVIGLMPLPLGVAVNFLINGKDFLVPMCIEEPSVIAAASNAARMARVKGGFKAGSTAPVMIGQIQVVDLPNPFEAMLRVLRAREEVLEAVNRKDPVLVKLGGGARDLTAKVLDTVAGYMLIVELHVDVRDAMGANVVNTMCEAAAPLIEDLTGGKVLLRILTNLATERLAWAEAVFDKEVIGGPEVVEAVLKAHAFALADPYRAATHNKGIMNGIVAVALATGNDTRALEAGAHAYAARTGRYQPLTHWWRTAEGDLAGRIELPLAVGVVGGATGVHPIAKIARKILGVTTAQELAEVMASVGLAQNFAALRALATEGIQRGHMKLHARNLAIAAGATGELIDLVARRMVEEGNIRLDRAREILEDLKTKA